MRNKHREVMEDLQDLRNKIEDIRADVRCLLNTAGNIMALEREARSLLEDLKKRWEAMDDDKA